MDEVPASKKNTKYEANRTRVRTLGLPRIKKKKKQLDIPTLLAQDL